MITPKKGRCTSKQGVYKRSEGIELILFRHNMPTATAEDPLHHLQHILLSTALGLKAILEESTIYPAPEVSTTTYTFRRSHCTIGDDEAIKTSITRLRNRLIIQNLKVTKWRVVTSPRELVVAITSGKVSGPFSRWVVGPGSSTERMTIEYGTVPHTSE